MRLLEVLCARLRQTSELLEEALFLEGASRLAKRLVHLAEIFGKPTANGTRIDIQLSQQQLGNMVGMSRESMNKQLRQWRQEKLISVEDGCYVLSDIDAMRDPARTHRMGLAGRDHVSGSYSWDQTAQTILGRLDKVKRGLA